MYSNVYTVQYKENGQVQRELVAADDILKATKLYSQTYPDRLILSIVHQSPILI